MKNGGVISNTMAVLYAIVMVAIIVAVTLFLIKTRLWFYIFPSFKESIFGIIISLIFDW